MTKAGAAAIVTLSGCKNTPPGNSPTTPPRPDIGLLSNRDQHAHVLEERVSSEPEGFDSAFPMGLNISRRQTILITLRTLAVLHV